MEGGSEGELISADSCALDGIGNDDDDDDDDGGGGGGDDSDGEDSVDGDDDDEGDEGDKDAGGSMVATFEREGCDIDVLVVVKGEEEENERVRATGDAVCC